MAQALGSKLTENGERNNKQEQFPTSMYAELRNIMQLLTQNRAEAENGPIAIDRKFNGLGKNIKAEALTSANSPIQNHTKNEWEYQDESRVTHSRPKMPYH